jgi:hypothetical protein
MARSYYSTVFDESADRVWSAIRDFGNYTLWVDGVDEVRIEDGKSGDTSRRGAQRPHGRNANPPAADCAFGPRPIL